MRRNKKLWHDELILKNPNPTYKQLLNTYDWEIKRFHIMRRDKFQCTKCGIMARKQLRVHHKKYSKKLLPWEYNDKYLITLCDECHSKIHGKENLHAKFRKGLAKYIKDGFRFK